MAYSNWATVEDFKSKLFPVSYDSDIKKSGIPMMYDDNFLYIKNDEPHTMVIGAQGSGKTQSIVLPQLKLAIKAQESFITYDVKGEIYEELSGELKKQGYNTIVINLENPELGNGFNPLLLPYKIYKEGNKDKSIELLERVGHYFINNINNSNADPFWSNSAILMFVGLSLFLFENANEEEINILSLINLATNYEETFEQIRKSTNKIPFNNMANVILAPKDTQGGIISVFLQHLNLFASKESLQNLLSFTDFELRSIQSEKTALFIISNNRETSNRLIPLIIDECYFASIYQNNKERRLNIVIDEFGSIMQFKDFNYMLTTARSQNIKYTIIIKSFIELKNSYGEDVEILKMLFENIIYLLANDRETLETISNLCGKTQTDNGIEPLISVEELKLLNMFEAIVIMPRINPVRTKLLPNYKISWGFSDEPVEMKKITKKEISVYEIK